VGGRPQAAVAVADSHPSSAASSSFSVSRSALPPSPSLSWLSFPGGGDDDSACGDAALRLASPGPSPATSAHQVRLPHLFSSRCAKRSGPNPRVTYSFSDLTQLQVCTCITHLLTSILLQNLSGVFAWTSMSATGSAPAMPRPQAFPCNFEGLTAKFRVAAFNSCDQGNRILCLVVWSIWNYDLGIGGLGFLETISKALKPSCVADK